MIFVTVGTSSWDFTRLIKEMDQISEEIDEEVIMQIGSNKYEPKNSKFFKITSEKEIEELYENARIIVAHAGIGAIISARRHNKPIIIVPRRKDFKEHFDDHQIDTARELEKEGIVKVIWDLMELKKVLKENHADTIIKKNKHLIISLRGYINNLDSLKG